MKVDIEKEIRSIIEFHCGGSYLKRQKATELIMQIYQKQQLHIRIVCAQYGHLLFTER